MPELNIDFTWGIKIPLRDGVQLNATLYRPVHAEPTPAIFTLTPYISDGYHPRAVFFSQHGFAFLLVDCRGRGNSQGSFEPIVNEGRDAYDVVEWIARQPWCNGQVTMWGGSYAGFDQWMALKEFPPHLKTIVPVASPHAGVDFPFFKNIWFSYEMQWQTYTSGVTRNENLFQDQSFWIAKFRQRYLEHLPFRHFDRIVGNTTTIFSTMLDHPIPDEYWQRMALSEEEYRRINLPILSITGAYDDDQPGAMAYYRQHMHFGSEVGKAKHYLIIGPWDHLGTRTPAQEFSGLKFAEASLLDMNKLHQEWYDWTLKGAAKPEFLKDHVAYYLMGAEEWRYASSLEAISTTGRRLYLNSSAGMANDVFHSGSLAELPPLDSQPDAYIYDPLDVHMAELEREEIKNNLSDQRYDLNLFGAGLVYHTAPFEVETDIAGFVRLVVWLEIDVPDTDFWVILSEILADGSRVRLAEDFLRARYRESLTAEILVIPGEINCYQFDGFTFFARRIARGSRLRLVIRAPNSIYFQKNYNSGGVVADETAQDARTTHVRLYHDAEHLSYLELPVI